MGDTDDAMPNSNENLNEFLEDWSTKCIGIEACCKTIVAKNDRPLMRKAMKLIESHLEIAIKGDGVELKCVLSRRDNEIAELMA